MQELFKTIAIPIDFTANTDLAINKALEVAGTDAVIVHLIHVHKPAVPVISSNKIKRKAAYTQAETSLQEWKESIEDYLPAAKVLCWIISSHFVQRTIINKACDIRADLIVIGKTSNPGLFTVFNAVLPSQIARASGCAVLTAKPGALHNKIKNVVVPISENVPSQKMNVIAALSKRNRIKIFLVTFQDKENNPEGVSASALLKLYQWLKISIHCQVEYAVLQGPKKARALLRYAEINKADVLLLNLEMETKIGWPRKHICDVLSTASKVQVLTVGTN